MSGYRAFSAGTRANLRASSRNHGKRRLTREDRLRRYIIEKLWTRGSPREIVKRLHEEYPDDRTMRISHEAIDRSIYVLLAGRSRPHSLRPCGKRVYTGESGSPQPTRNHEAP